MQNRNRLTDVDNELMVTKGESRGGINLESGINRSVSQFSCSVVSYSLQPHGLQHARPPCPSATPRACSNSWPWSWWCHPTISSCFPLLLLPSTFPRIRVFSNESILCIRWPKYWSFSFSISTFNEYSGHPMLGACNASSHLVFTTIFWGR